VKEQVKKEGPGILNWALDGLARLRQHGSFVIPDEVGKASSDYKAANDIPAAFLAECCDVDTTGRSGFKVSSGELYQAYKQWCLDNGHKPKSSTALAEDWKRLGLKHRVSGGYAYWHGAELRQIRVTV
jgi:putative DNA primase/helicase